MKRFLLFGGDIYYASGGWKDFQGSFETLKEAQSGIVTDSDGFQSVNDAAIQWYQIVDLESLEIVEREEEPYESW